MINNLSLRIVSKIVSSVVAAVAIDVSDVKINVGNFVFCWQLSRRKRIHLLTHFRPSIYSLKLISFFLSQLKIFAFPCYLLIKHFFLYLFGGFWCKAKSLHPSPAVKVILKHGLKLIIVNRSVLIVVILFEFGFPNIRRVFFLEKIEFLEISEDGGVKLTKAVNVHLT